MLFMGFYMSLFWKNTINHRCYLIGLALSVGINTQVLAHGEGASGSRADLHAPISIMGDHTHKKGEVMISLRSMSMSMSGNVRGSNDISDEEIVTTIANNTSAAPPTLRIVPQEMTVDMHMLGIMYAPTDALTLMAMASRVDRRMTLTTFQGASGTTPLGDFETQGSGFGDVKVGFLLAAAERNFHKLHFNFVLSIPTGSIEESDTILTPAGQQVEVRLPYTMQVGSGTHDVNIGATYNGHDAKSSWGTQLILLARLGTNDEGYSLGDEQNLRAWWQYAWTPSFSTGLNIQHNHAEDISGSDALISGPVQTADPLNYGGTRTNLGVSFNLLGQKGFLKGHRLAFEYGVTIDEHRNGVQMSMDDMWTVGYQYAF